MKKICICLTIMMLSAVLNAQIFKVGDKYPGFQSKDAFNYTSSYLKSSDFKGKLIILDFWDVNCLSCIQAFPKMESLQAKFNDKIQIILINKQGKDSTSRFFARRKKIKIPNLPFITNDKILNNQFPHKSVPFHVWIDSSGIIKYITYGYNATPAHVSQFLQGNNLSISNYISSEYIETFLDKKWATAVDYYSFITRCINGVVLSASRSKGDHERITMSCKSIVELYQKAFNENQKNSFDKAGRTILEVTDSFQYIRPSSGDGRYDLWNFNHSYNYQLLVPKSKIRNKYQIMKEDLKRYFSLEATVELRDVKCLTLVRTSEEDKLRTKNGKKEFNFYRFDSKRAKNDSVRYVANYPFDSFSNILSVYLEKNFQIPFVDQTNYQGNIDFQLSGKVFDDMSINELRKEFNKYDLDLVEKILPISVLVIKEPNRDMVRIDKE